jgi:uncharacterized protein YtpQ (UPF0354 family)
MRVKKFKGKPYGVEFTAQEQKAMTLEINRQIAEKDEQYKENIDAMVLYVLMAYYGWKKKRLRKFWNAFIAEHKALREFYQVNDSEDSEWLAHRMLKEIGVDIHQWYKEDAQYE